MRPGLHKTVWGGPFCFLQVLGLREDPGPVGAREIAVRLHQSIAFAELELSMAFALAEKPQTEDQIVPVTVCPVSRPLGATLDETLSSACGYHLKASANPDKHLLRVRMDLVSS